MKTYNPETERHSADRPLCGFVIPADDTCRRERRQYRKPGDQRDKRANAYVMNLVRRCLHIECAICNVVAIANVR